MADKLVAGIDSVRQKVRDTVGVVEYATEHDLATAIIPYGSLPFQAPTNPL